MAFMNPVAEALPRFAQIIGEAREEHGSGPLVAHVYPGTATVTREIAMANADDVDRAVAAARQALPAWKAMPGDKRRNLLFRLAELCEASSGDFAASLIAENGSVAMTAPYMGYDAAQKFRYFGGWCDKLHGRTVPMWGAPRTTTSASSPMAWSGSPEPRRSPSSSARMASPATRSRRATSDPTQASCWCPMRLDHRSGLHIDGGWVMRP